MCILEREELTYAQHVERVPMRVRDVGGSIISAMLMAQGETTEAVVQLKELVQAQSVTLPKIVAADRQAAASLYGHFVDFEFPWEREPLWRPQYSTALALAGLYVARGDTEQAVSVAQELADVVSPDGWHPRINELVARRLEDAGRWSEAAYQYELAAKGTESRARGTIQRKAYLLEHGAAIHSPDFISWEHEVLILSGWQAIIDTLMQRTEHATARAR